jgi:hypothetical protein
VLHTTIEDWQRFIHFLRHAGYPLKLATLDEVGDLPQDVSTLFRDDDILPDTLSIQVHGMLLNCHFFTESEIELDLDPREVSDAEQWNHLRDFVLEMACALAMEVRLTEENWQEGIWFLFRPTGDFEFYPASSTTGD